MNRRGRRPYPDILTPREWEVLELLRQKLTNQEIAASLGISADTAKYHVSEIITKLGVSDRRKAADWARTAARRPFAFPAVLTGLAGRAWTTTARRIAFGATTIAAAAAIAVLAWGLLTVKKDPANIDLVPGVYVVDADGGELKRLTDDAYICDLQCGLPHHLLSWSPDGKTLLINDSFGASRSLLTASVDGGALGLLPTQAWSATWLATGEIIGHGRLEDRGSIGEALVSINPQTGRMSVIGEGAFGDATFTADGRYGLVVVATPRTGLLLLDRRSGEQRLLLEGRFSYPAWSADGSAFAVNLVDSRDGRMSVFVYRAEGTLMAQGLPGQRPAWSPGGGLLASTDYRRVEDRQDAWIVLSDPKGVAPPRDLTLGTNPVFAPDGKSLAFIRDGELWRIGTDGKDERKVVKSALPMIAEAQWSPDGSRIALIATSGGGRLYAIGADGRDERYLAPGTRPLWSPDGSRLAFFFGSGIFVMSRGAEDITLVATTMYSDAIAPCTSGPTMTWSPDSKRLAYWTYGIRQTPYAGGVIHVWDGHTDKRVADGYGPVWLPDGQTLAFTDSAATNPPACAVSTVPAHGGTPALALEGALSPSWTRDGKYLAYLASQAPGPSFGEITIATADGKTIIKRLGSGRGFAWSPDGDHYAYVRLPGRPAAPPGPGAPLPPPPVVVPPDATVKLIIGSVVGGDPEIEIPVLFSSEFAWSPDGRSLAYTSREDPAAPSDIFVMEIAHPESPRYLTSGSSPGWLADGRTIVFSR